MEPVKPGWFDALGHPVPERRRAAALDLLVRNGFDAKEATVVLGVVCREIEHDEPARAKRYLDTFLVRKNQTLVYMTLATLTSPAPGEYEDDLLDLLRDLGS